MNPYRILEELEDCPVIAAIKDESGLNQCITSDIQIVFVLYGDICNIKQIVERLKAAGKTVMVHIDLISGLSSREIAVHFLKDTTKADGVISTKPTIIKQARELGLFTIMRFFVIDSINLLYFSTIPSSKCNDGVLSINSSIIFVTLFTRS